MLAESKPHILIIDDDERIVELLSEFFKKNGFVTSGAFSVEEAEEALRYFSFDLIILDVMLPEVSGIDFAKSLRLAKNLMPIIMLTALSAPEDRVGGLESGADDYLIKPFEPKELLLRVRNLIESGKRDLKSGQVFYLGHIFYDFKSKTLFKGDKPIKISAVETKILELLLKNQGEVLSRDLLSKETGNSGLRSIDVLITRIRSKIEEDPKNPRFLKTFRGEGYGVFL